jgi:hypothetical protein
MNVCSTRFYVTLVFFIMIPKAQAMQFQFDDAQQLARKRALEAEQQIKSEGGKKNIPRFQEGFRIDQDETANAFEHAKNSEAGKAVFEIHKDRGMYKFDENDPLISKSEEYHKDPQKILNEIETRSAGKNDYTIEYCEECSDDEYLVTARRTKKRYVYLQTPPYITAGQSCKNHGWLSIRVEIVNEPEEVFREDGIFENIQLTGKTQNGAVISEYYLVNGVQIELRKTIYQNGHPWIRPGCYLVPALQGNVVNSADLIRKLLGGAEDEDMWWGEIGAAHLYHRVVNDTGEHYWLPDDKCQEYEKLTEEGFCRYHAMVEDPPSDKYWKGKKVRGSWGQTVTYACKSPGCRDTCSTLRQRGCEQIGSECLKTIGSHCVKWLQKFRCLNKIKADKYKFSGNTAFCLDGNCIDSSFQSDQDMVSALGYLSILEAARKEMDGTTNIQIFKGQSHSCTRWCLSFKDCCNCGGWGVSLGLSRCDENSKKVVQLRNEGKCVQIGTYCAEKEPILKTCIRKKTVFCCFGSKFAKLLQEQGKRQLRKNFGSPEHPNCRGFTAEELSRIDFSQLDLTEISQEVMEKFIPPDAKKHFAKGDELQKIRESMIDLHIMKKMQDAGSREGAYLQENMKHLTESARTK